jgi:hypothetical protein
MFVVSCRNSGCDRAVPWPRYLRSRWSTQCRRRSTGRSIPIGVLRDRSWSRNPRVSASPPWSSGGRGSGHVASRRRSGRSAHPRTRPAHLTKPRLNGNDKVGWIRVAIGTGWLPRSAPRRGDGTMTCPSACSPARSGEGMGDRGRALSYVDFSGFQNQRIREDRFG